MSEFVHVFADWEGLERPILIGALRCSVIRNKAHFSFSYDRTWLRSPTAQEIDPNLALYAGEQHSDSARNFRVFLDSCPDRWGRLLQKRREAIWARKENRRPELLNELDYLLGVDDLCRMGALRFKRHLEGEFLDSGDALSAPPISSLGELEHAAQNLELNSDATDYEASKWLALLLAPGSSLGGARPKSSVVDEEGHLWIAKFPSCHDDYDIGAWEYLVYLLAIGAGIEMAPCRIERLGSHHHTFLTKRFDRRKGRRLHFSSAMTQLGYDDGDDGASYLELAQFLTENGSAARADLEQLWRRIVFNIAVSNTDDHLRNHGFIYQNGGWVLSPAYDINPVTPANGLHLNISDRDNSLDFDLALEVIDYFRLSANRAHDILDEVLASVGQWEEKATSIGIGRAERRMMATAFRARYTPEQTGLENA